MFTLYIDKADGKWHYLADELPGFTVDHDSRTQATRFRTIEAARALAFELMTADLYRFCIWDLNTEQHVQNVGI